MSQLKQLAAKLAARFGMESNERELLDTLKATAFRQDGNTQISDAQMTALLIVANQYGLNPFTKELYAFPHKGSIVPIVGLDGWARIINDSPMFDGMEFSQDDESCTCRIYRKDRSHPTEVTEYMVECYRETAPWKSHKRRMLRHKTMIQCARLAFSFSGIYDEDEAERIVERDITPQVDVITADQAAVLRDKLTAIGMDESMFLTKCDIKKLEELPASRLAGATNWLDTRKPAAVTITQQPETGEQS